ncbi:MAG TPA: GNAT family N-acetyltransferase [Symbiobacteriaceae bacterium]|jgi:GNAT superfamily N-acetyltransferase|nr:GNAT family N-acetyltransferase [Symbiobacteriaceae bacterium]
MDTLQIFPATPDRWSDLEALFGARGACGGCWCMSWRLKKAEFEAGKGESNRAQLKALVEGAHEPGVIAYADGQPIGWCSVAPREQFPRLAGSRTLRPVDEEPVWSISCLFVAKHYRRQGVSVALLNGACAFAAQRGAQIVEGYPTEPAQDLPAPFVWTGLASAFRQAGFAEVIRRANTRPIMRRFV